MSFASLHPFGTYAGPASEVKPYGMVLFLVVLVVVIIRHGAGAT